MSRIMIVSLLILTLCWPGLALAAQDLPRASHALSGRIPTAPAYDPYITALIQQVRGERIADFIAELSGERAVTIGGKSVRLTTRYTYSGEPIAQATQYLYERLQALGYTVAYHPYRYNGYDLRNVVAEKRGTLRPNEIFLLTAHVDDRAATWPHNPAPGADDNASGTAALLAIAEVLAPLQVEATVRFVFFTGEEQGKRGSDAYVYAASRAKETLAGTYNVDMIGWDSTGEPDVDIHTLSSATPNDSQALADLLVHVINQYTLPLKPQIYRSGTDFSDHYSVWKYGYPAVLVIEDWYNAAGGPYDPRDWNPNYHTKNDQLSTLNLSYAQAIARAVMAATLHLVRPLRTLQGTVRAPDATPLAASLRLSGPAGTWSTTAPTGTYSFTVPADTYTLEVGASRYYTRTLAVNLVDVTPKVFDVTLEPWEFHTIYGTLRDAINALPLTGTLSVDGGAAQPVGERFSLSLLRGEHTLTVSAPYHIPQTRVIQTTPAQNVDFALTPAPCLLLVDDDEDGQDETLWVQTLSALGYPFGVMTVAPGSAGPSAEELARYYGVVWVTGSAAAPLLDADVSALHTYLHNQGHLLLSGTQLNSGAWDANLFHAQPGGAEVNASMIIGSAFLEPLTLPLRSNSSPQRLTPTTGAIAIARYPSGTEAAIAYRDMEHGAIVLGFDVEAISDEAGCVQTLERLLAYLAPCPAYALDIVAPKLAFGVSAVALQTTLVVVNRGYRSDRYRAEVESWAWPAALSAMQSQELAMHEAWRPVVKVSIPPTSPLGSSTQVTVTVRSQSALYVSSVHSFRIVHAWQMLLPLVMRR